MASLQRVQRAQPKNENGTCLWEMYQISQIINYFQSQGIERRCGKNGGGKERGQKVYLFDLCNCYNKSNRAEECFNDRMKRTE